MRPTLSGISVAILYDTHGAKLCPLFSVGSIIRIREQHAGTGLSRPGFSLSVKLSLEVAEPVKKLQEFNDVRKSKTLRQQEVS